MSLTAAQQGDLGRFTGWILIPRRQGGSTGTAPHGHAGAPTKVGSQFPCCLLPAGQIGCDFTAYQSSLCSTSGLRSGLTPCF